MDGANLRDESTALSSPCRWCRPGARCPVHAPDLTIEVGGDVYLLLSEVLSAIREARAATRLELVPRAACSGPIGASGSSRSVVLELLQAWNASGCQPPLAEDEVHRCVASISQRERRCRSGGK